MIKHWLKLALFTVTLAGTQQASLASYETLTNGGDNQVFEDLLDETKSVNKKLKYYFGENLVQIPPGLFIPPSLNQTQTIQLAYRSLLNSFSLASGKINDSIYGIVNAAPDWDLCSSAGSDSDKNKCIQNSYKNKLLYLGRFVPIPFPYASKGDERAYRFDKGADHQANSFLLSPETIFGKSEFGNLSEPVNLLNKEKLTTEEQAAHTFSDYLVTAIPPKLPKSVANVTSESTLKAIISSRAYAAYYATLKGNLDDMIALRKKQGEPANKSLLRIEEEMATKRINKASTDESGWYMKIANASPETVQREVAYLLAEMNYQLYLNRRMSEKLLMTMTAIGAGSLSMKAADAEGSE